MAKYILIFAMIFQFDYAYAKVDLSTCIGFDEALSSSEIEKIKSYLAGNSEPENFWPSKGYLAGLINDYSYIKNHQYEKDILSEAFYVSLIRNLALAHQLLPLFSNINMYSGNLTPLMMAVNCNRPTLVKKIIAMGGDIDLRTKDLNYDILTLAILTKDNDLVNLLIKYGASCKTSKLSNGLTALELAHIVEAPSIISSLKKCLDKKKIINTE